MNCFSACKEAASRWSLPVLALLVTACGVPASESADRGGAREYSVHYTLRLDTRNSTVHVSMDIAQPAGLLREVSFATADHLADVEGDGSVASREGRTVWTLPPGGGELEWQATVHHARGRDSFDAFLGPDWGIFRMEDVIPRMRTRALRDAKSRTTLEFELPTGWSAVSEYSAKELPIVVDRPERSFDQPTGWIAAGRLGVRRETIAGTKVGIAAPEGHDVRRMEMLAVLNWTLPELNSILPQPMPRLTIVSAGAPMWRGGLSAPASFYLHADRPLISENGTSPLLHEVMHSALGTRPARGYDWIVEGLAEYYGIELARRGKAITAERATRAFDWQAEWASRAEGLCGPRSTAATTALAVTLFVALNREITDRTEGLANLDDVLPMLVDGPVDLAGLAAAASEVIGATPDALHIDKLPGCRTIAAGTSDN